MDRIFGGMNPKEKCNTDNATHQDIYDSFARDGRGLPRNKDRKCATGTAYSEFDHIAPNADQAHYGKDGDHSVSKSIVWNEVSDRQSERHTGNYPDETVAQF